MFNINIRLYNHKMRLTGETVSSLTDPPLSRLQFHFRAELSAWCWLKQQTVVYFNSSLLADKWTTQQALNTINEKNSPRVFPRLEACAL